MGALDELMGAVRDPRFRQDMRTGVVDAANNGIVASTLGAPADLGNLLLNAIKAAGGYAGHKAGLLKADQLPTLQDNPLLGSEWWSEKMRQAGMTSGNRNTAAEVLMGGLLGPAVGAQVSAKAPQIAAGLLRHQDQFQAYNRALGPAGASQATVWHGSPHKFDRFDSSKIGTGEGAQAYGHGLYLAESRDVAQGYQNTLSSAQNRKFIDGTYRVVDDGGTFAVVKDVAEPVGSTRNYVRQSEQISDGFPSRGHALSWLKKQGVDNLRIGKIEDGAIRQAKSVRDIPEGDAVAAWNGGNLYKVDLPDPLIARMLDWDKPLSQQAPSVAAKAKAALDARYGAGTFDSLAANGADLRDLTQNFDDLGRGGMEAMFRAAGIPGIRYLDGGSRGAGVGSSNFVVFPGEETALRILERNGLAP